MKAGDHTAKTFAQEWLHRLFPAQPVPTTSLAKKSAWKNPIGSLFFTSAFHVVRVSSIMPNKKYYNQTNELYFQLYRILFPVNLFLMI